MLDSNFEEQGPMDKRSKNDGHTLRLTFESSNKLICRDLSLPNIKTANAHRTGRLREIRPSALRKLLRLRQSCSQQGFETNCLSPASVPGLTGHRLTAELHAVAAHADFHHAATRAGLSCEEVRPAEFCPPVRPQRPMRRAGQGQR